MTRSFNRCHLVFSEHYKFSRQKSVVKVKSRMKLTSQASCACVTGVIVKYLKNTLNPILILFTFAIFAFHILFDLTTIATQQFLPAKHFKINKNIKYEVLFHNL
jgi:hypothetical protein